ncbi:MAG: hypothetical protein BWY04_01180 [candidate division CPR1 bacterium ADurb.Bin160]|uniref:NlpC/P60 domain-containing protein n=1 Tax=candidate division CPR1 bacterium ADurb.Bin160 TaxID=1852826 RepID=A0A1V5ZKY5_9BACT|nr:MAG: hypothetical protein BWY04_01180 [candidate division CPR1 bacterium ADurb.Bin160]
MKQEMIKNKIEQTPEQLKENLEGLINDETLQALADVLKITLKDKFIYAIKHPITIFTGRFFLALVIIIISCLASIKIYTMQPKEIIQPITAEDFSDAETFKKLQESYKNYLTLSKKQRLIAWIVKFSNVTYKLDGNPKYDQYDCVGAFAYYMWGFGSNVRHETVTNMVKRLENLVSNGSCKKRKNITQVVPGDIVIIQTERNRPSHVGVVYDVRNNFMQIMDVSVKANGMDIYDKSFNDYMINAVYETSFSFWIGDLLKQI